MKSRVWDKSLDDLEIVANIVFSSTSTLFFPLFLFSGFLSIRFRSKYHPDEASRRKAEAHSALQNRLNVYMFLIDNGWFDSISLDIERAQPITKILDAGMDNWICLPDLNVIAVLKFKRQLIEHLQLLPYVSQHINGVYVIKALTIFK